MSSLGIYFGPKFISVVETQGKSASNDIQISQVGSNAAIEETASEEIKIIALLKDELRQARIEKGNINIGLSGKDLIVRTFEIPSLPREELANAISYEAKKYIPFKIEELISSYQIKPLKNRTNQVLFLGVKKTSIDRYISILSQLNVNVTGIEYSAFSLLRLLKLNHISTRGIIGVLSLDFQEQDEISFTILDDNFPLFSRDISLSTIPNEGVKPEDATQGDMFLLDKLKSELRVSLDFYNRKFSGKDLKKIVVIAPKESHTELNALSKEMGLEAKFIDIKPISKSGVFSLSAIKAYACSIGSSISSDLKVNLLAAFKKAKVTNEAVVETEGVSILSGIRLLPQVVVAAVIIGSLMYFYGVLQNMPIQNEIKRIVSERPQGASVNPDVSYTELRQVNEQYTVKLKMLDDLVNQQLFLTKPLDSIPRLLPDGMWLTDFNYQNDGKKMVLILRGVAYQADADLEVQLINAFIGKLKENEELAKYFKDINVDSIDRIKIRNANVSNFSVTCEGISNRQKDQ